MSIDLIATTTFGLEAVVKRECQALGFQNIRTSDGKVEFTGDAADIVKANLWLRCAGRVWVKMGTFKAVTFTELFDQTKELPWGDWIPEDGKFTVVGKSVKSTLFSVPDCQAIVGRVVSGDQFISSKEVKDALISNFQGDCAEMEGASIAHTCYLNKIPFVIIRAISDKADDSAEMDYPTFEREAAKHCAMLTKEFVQKL